MYPDEDLLPISALQHLLFCERQCALIHLEQLWAENRLTVEGRQLHERTHEGPDERRQGVYVIRGLGLRSLRLGLVGKADVVEFEPPGRGPPQCRPGELFGIFRRDGIQGWRVTPVEYKRGRPKPDATDKVQLVAQALCLEEMLGAEIPSGYIFYGRPRRRTEVLFDAPLRKLAEETARRLHELIGSGRTPPARREPKCENCSLVDVCLPDAVAPGRSAAEFTRWQLARLLASSGPNSDPFEEAPP